MTLELWLKARRDNILRYELTQSMLYCLFENALCTDTIMCYQFIENPLCARLICVDYKIIRKAIK